MATLTGAMAFLTRMLCTLYVCPKLDKRNQFKLFMVVSQGVPDQKKIDSRQPVTTSSVGFQG